MEDDRLGDDGAELRHTLGQPGRHPAIVQGQIGASGAAGHGSLLWNECGTLYHVCLMKDRPRLSLKIRGKSAALARVTNAVSCFTGGMIDAISIAGSALAAQTVSLAVTSDNVANAMTPGFTAKQAQFVAMNPGVAVGAIVDSGQGVDLADQMINLILAKTAYQAAADVFRTADQMTKTLLAM